jgi:hypothetical protein
MKTFNNSRKRRKKSSKYIKGIGKIKREKKYTCTFSIQILSDGCASVIFILLPLVLK